MRPGELREIVVFERPVESQDDVGETVISWEPYRRLYAKVASVGFFQAIRAEQVSMNSTHLVTVRWAPGISGDHRMRWESNGGRKLYISSIVERGSRQWIEITAEEHS